jgi:hypothetical protein
VSEANASPLADPILVGLPSGSPAGTAQGLPARSAPRCRLDVDPRRREAPAVAKYHYWKTFGLTDDDESSIDPGTPSICFAPSQRRTDDTLLRYIFWAQLTATVGTASLPNVDWIANASVDWLFYFDLATSGFQVNIFDDNPLTIGFTTLQKSVYTTTTANKYQVIWQSPAEGISVETSRKGDGVDQPALSAQRWVSDNYGVFGNFSGFSVLFSSRIIGRALWASDQAP